MNNAVSIRRATFGVLAGVVVVAGLSATASAQYNNEVNRWLAQDAADPIEPGGIVFTGSSSIRRWENLQRDFADYNLVQRGLGGAQFDDINAQAGNVVLSYQPRAVVVWAGTNDIASGSNAAEVVADYNQFVNTIQGASPDTEIFYLGIMPTPGRQGNRPVEDSVNGQISAIASGDAKQHYINLPGAFATLNPYDDPDFRSKFVDDIHLNKSGYDFWTSIIRPEISAVLAPDKENTATANAMQLGESLLFDFGPSDGNNGDNTTSPDVNGNHWNNWVAGTPGGRDILPGEHVGGLYTSTGRNTDMSLTLTAQFESNGKNNGGLFNPDPALLGDFAVQSVTVDYFFSTGDDLQGGGDDDDGGGFKLDGLDPSLAYDIEFFGTRNSTEVRRTEYRVFGDGEWVAELQTSGPDIGADGMYDGNNDEIVSVTGVKPNEFGEIFVDITKLQGSFAYIGALRITAVPEPSAALLTGSAALLLIRRRVR